MNFPSCIHTDNQRLKHTVPKETERCIIGIGRIVARRGSQALGTPTYSLSAMDLYGSALGSVCVAVTAAQRGLERCVVPQKL